MIDDFSNKAFDPFGSVTSGGAFRTNQKQASKSFRKRAGSYLPSGYKSPSTFDFSNGQSGGSFLDQAGAALRTDVGQLQKAANRGFERNQKAIGDIGDLTNQADAQIAAATEQSTGLLASTADQAAQAGDDAVSGFNDFAEGIMSKADADVDSIMSGADATADRARKAADTIGKNIDKNVGAMTKQALDYAKQSVAAAKEAVTGFNANSQRAVRAVALGMERRLDSTLKQIEGGLNPDGSVMTPAERMEARVRLEDQVNSQVAEVTGQMWQDSQKFSAQLKDALSSAAAGAGQIALGAAGTAVEGEKVRLGAESLAAQTGAQAGELKLGAAGLRAQTGTTIGQQRLEAENIRLGYTQVRSALNSTIAAIQNSNAFNLMNFKMQGRAAMADLVRQNPESYVGIFSGLMQLGQIATAPGGRNIGRVNF